MFDEQKVPNATLNDLEPKLWKRFKTLISPADDQEFLEKLKLITRDEDNKIYPTVSGILMASEAPESFLPSAYIQAVRYRYTERNAARQQDGKTKVEVHLENGMEKRGEK
ncbi:Uncharacterized protein dnl_46410 [Desulfonema limicola]|uniref:Uncharacterized protein n=1 Tax=Desulfonema limicola TaxID=45656 RepID=A0A975BB95_9BACT|nr:hypothetical protein [Desulfonema limicola]QTA82268.1 Uncharacterized protein dnl_46410 [Desulfonema limicola]